MGCILAKQKRMLLFYVIAFFSSFSCFLLRFWRLGSFFYLCARRAINVEFLRLAINHPISSAIVLKARCAT